MRWETEHIRRLRRDLNNNCSRVCDALATEDGIEGREEYTTVDGVSIRTSVDGLRSILSEIRKLK